MRRRIFMIVGVGFSLASVWAPRLWITAAVQPRTLTVSQTAGAADFTTITAAINAANAGDTVEIIDSAVYSESLTIGSNKNGLTLRAREGQTPTLTATSNSIIRVFGAENITIRGLIITGGAGNGLTTLGAPVKNLMVQDCRFEAIPFRAVVLDNGDTAVIRECSFVNVGEAGISLSGVAFATIVGNEFRGGPLNAGDGVQLLASSADIIGNTFVGLGQQGITTFEQSEGAPVRQSTIKIINNLIARSGTAVPDFGDGIQVVSSANTINQFTIVNNTIVGSARLGIGFELRGTGQVLLANTIVTGSGGSGDLQFYTGVGPSCSLQPMTATNPVGTSHTVTITVERVGNPISGALVTFSVPDGPNIGVTGTRRTDNSGRASFTYMSNRMPGIDTIKARADVGNETTVCSATVTWVSPGQIGQIAVPSQTSQITIRNCLIGRDAAFDSVGRNGNITGNPRFVDPTNNNYRLQQGSPAIDTGDNSAISGFMTDLDGNPRIADGDGDGTATIDIGAFEAVAAAQPILKADYQFQNTLTSSVSGAPALMNLGNNAFVTATVDGAQWTVLNFAQNNGLALSPTAALIPNDAYTVVILFAFSNVNGYRRILDFKNGTSDSGLYVLSGQLTFFPVASGFTPIAANAYVQVVLTRDASGNVAGYVNGVRQFSFADRDGRAVIDANNTLRFFRDNTSGGAGNEASAGSVARLRLYDGALSASAVAALDRLPMSLALVSNLSAFPGATASASSSFSAYPPDRIKHGNLNTSWFSAIGDAANLGKSPWAEVVFPFDATVVQTFASAFRVGSGRRPAAGRARGCAAPSLDVAFIRLQR